MDSVKVRNAFISVSDKSGLEKLAPALKKFGAEIISSSGTAAFLKQNGVEVADVSKITGFPEILGGRVKTLHPKIAGAILARADNDSDDRELLENGIGKVDLVVVNFYPFEKTVEDGKAALADAVEKIDVGGPTMLRAAAKNFDRVCAVCDPADYPALIDELEKSKGSISEATRRRLAAKAFQYAFSYDSAVANYLSKQFDPQKQFPDALGLGVTKVQDLRYGENPHQKAALYSFRGKAGDELTARKQLWGKELSFNNVLDIDAVVGLALEFAGQRVAVIVKHSNPCGVALGKTNAEAFDTALSTDPVSAFGGIICFNNPVGKEEADKIAAIFCEIVIAPSFEPDALEALKVKKNLRIIVEPLLSAPSPSKDGLDIRGIRGGILIQEPDDILYAQELKTVTKREPTEQERADLDFAWKVCKHVKSNAVVYIRGGRTIGVGAGQMSRVDSAKIASMKAAVSKLDTKGCVVASDAYFPFRDGIDESAKAGITAIIQPGGSIRDAEVIAAANEHGMAMLLTGTRHTWH